MKGTVTIKTMKDQQRQNVRLVVQRKYVYYSEHAKQDEYRTYIQDLNTGAIYSSVMFKINDLKISEQSENCAQHYPSLRLSIRNLRSLIAIYTMMGKIEKRWEQKIQK